MTGVGPDNSSVADRLQLEESWKQQLLPEFSRDYMLRLRAFLQEEKRRGKTIYPPGPQIFNALNTTPLPRVKVVILGQDPYHGPGQAHGLCFSVQKGTALPHSLRNIYKEIDADLGIPPAPHGCMQSWAEQGVLLLNAVLTVEAGRAASHQGKGWEQFTDRVIEVLNREREHLVFLLWGCYAQRKGAIIDRSRHLVLESVHPSPLSASRGFFGNHHFSIANRYLDEHGIGKIDWGVAS